VEGADLGYLRPGVPRRVSACVAVLVHSRMLDLDFALSNEWVRSFDAWIGV
jgi:hypothetical protein